MIWVVIWLLLLVEQLLLVCGICARSSSSSLGLGAAHLNHRLLQVVELIASLRCWNLILPIVRLLLLLLLLVHSAWVLKFAHVRVLWCSILACLRFSTMVVAVWTCRNLTVSMMCITTVKLGILNIWRLNILVAFRRCLGHTTFPRTHRVCCLRLLEIKGWILRLLSRHKVIHTSLLLLTTLVVSWTRCRFSFVL